MFFEERKVLQCLPRVCSSQEAKKPRAVDWLYRLLIVIVLLLLWHFSQEKISEFKGGAFAVPEENKQIKDVLLAVFFFF